MTEPIWNTSRIIYKLSDHTIEILGEDFRNVTYIFDKENKDSWFEYQQHRIHFIDNNQKSEDAAFGKIIEIIKKEKTK